MADAPTGYFAFVRRGPDGRYDAVLPDFPDREVRADTLGALVDALRHALRAGLDARSAQWPPPPRATGLPARVDGLDGYWLQVDLDAPRRR